MKPGNRVEDKTLTTGIARKGRPGRFAVAGGTWEAVDEKRE